MHVNRRLLALLAAVGGLACAPAAHAAADHAIDLSPGDAPKVVNGVTTVGFNTSWLLYETSTKAPAPVCGKDPNTMCESTLVHVTGDDIGDGTLTLRLDGFQPYSDFDLKSYESDASGTQGKKLASPVGDVTKSSPLGGSDPRQTAAGDFETTTLQLGDYLDGEGGPLDAYFLIEIPYFMVPNDTYRLTATLATTPFVPSDGE